MFQVRIRTSSKKCKQFVLINFEYIYCVSHDLWIPCNSLPFKIVYTAFKKLEDAF